jgi:hypothetical protein
MINLELTDAGARIWVDEYALRMQQKRVSAFFVRTGPAVKEKSKSGAEGPPTGPKDDALVNCVEAEADPWCHEPPLPSGPWPRTATATLRRRVRRPFLLCLTRYFISRPTCYLL